MSIAAVPFIMSVATVKTDFSQVRNVAYTAEAL
jgi:hypothetical protein